MLVDTKQLRIDIYGQSHLRVSFTAMAKTAQDVLRQIKDEGIELIDLKFTDLHGKWQHLTVCKDLIEPESFTEGLAFDGSSIRGWKAINASDMAMVPDPATAWIDPFYRHKTLSMICSIQDPRTGDPYERCPRALAQKALAYLAGTGLADMAFFGPEPEFFLFDDVRYNSAEGGSFYSVDTIEAGWNTGRIEEGGNLAYKIQEKEGYFPVAPNDTAQDIRSEMLLMMAQLGIPIEKHHHEVAGAGQHELGMKFAELIQAADNVMTYKYIVRNVDKKYGKTATFMPKPVEHLTGNGCHAHISVWDLTGQNNVFADDSEELGLSKKGLNFLGGIINHATSMTAITNPTVNSYKRINAPRTLSGASWAPNTVTWTSNNRTHMVRVPGPGRFELRLPDGAANPYLLQAAIIAAGMDGLKESTDPGERSEVNMYENREAISGAKKLPLNLLDALREFDANSTFKEAMGKEFSEAFVKLKMEEWNSYVSHFSTWEKENTLDI